MSSRGLCNSGSLMSRGRLTERYVKLDKVKFSSRRVRSLTSHVHRVGGGSARVYYSVNFLARGRTEVLGSTKLSHVGRGLGDDHSFCPRVYAARACSRHIGGVGVLRKLKFRVYDNKVINVKRDGRSVISVLVSLHRVGPRSIPVGFLLPVPKAGLTSHSVSRLAPRCYVGILYLTELVVPGSSVHYTTKERICFGKVRPRLFGIISSVFTSNCLATKNRKVSSAVGVVGSTKFSKRVRSASRWG